MATTQIKDGWNGGSDNQLKVNADGSINVVGGGSGGSNVNLTEVGGNPITTGQATMANSLPVVIASDQSSIPTTNPSVGTNGALAPTASTQIAGVTSGGDLSPLTVDPSGKLLVDISGTSTVTGTVNANIEGLTNFQTSQQTIGLTAIQLTPSPLTNRSSMSIKADTTSSLDMVYIGNSSSVTTANGYALFDGDSIQMDLTPAQTIWAIGTSAGQIVYILEIGD